MKSLSHRLGEVSRRLTVFAIAAIAVMSAQSQVRPAVEIHVPSAVRSETIFIRYCLFAESSYACRFLQPQPGRASYLIDAVYDGHVASRARGIIYAPNCAIERFDFPWTPSSRPSYSFKCHPLPNVSLRGLLTRVDRLYERAVDVYAKYIPSWTPRFFGVDQDVVIGIPVGDSPRSRPASIFNCRFPTFRKIQPDAFRSGQKTA